MTSSSSVMRSSADMSPSSKVMMARRSLANSSRMAAISVLMTPRRTPSSPRMASSSAMRLAQRGQLLLEVGPAQAGQLRQAHVDDVGGLHVAEHEGLRLQGGDGRLAVLRRPDGRDDGVDHVERLDQALDDVGPVPGLLEQELGPPADDLDLVGDVGAAAPAPG